MTYRFRYLDEADRERWPDWYEADIGAMDEMDTGVLLDWEASTGFLALATDDDSPQNIGAAAARRELRALLAIQYLAVRLAGVEVRWADFRPKMLQVEVDRAPEPPTEAAESGNPPGPAPRRATRRASSASAVATSPKPRKSGGRRASGS